MDDGRAAAESTSSDVGANPLDALVGSDPLRAHLPENLRTIEHAQGMEVQVPGWPALYYERASALVTQKVPGDGNSPVGSRDVIIIGEVTTPTQSL